MSVTTGVRRRRRRTGAVSAAVLAVLALVITGFAIAYDGLNSSEVEVNDGGVWVLNKKMGLIGRVNVDAGELDARLTATGDDLSIDQAGYNVFLNGGGGIRPVNTEGLSLRPTVQNPTRDTEFELGGDRVAITDQTGRVWILEPEQAASFDAENVKPTYEAEEGSVPEVKVGFDGTVYVLDGKELTVFPLSKNTAKPQKEDPVSIDGLSGSGDSVEMTVVGTEPVILDKESGLLRVGRDGDAVDLGAQDIAADAAVLQQPGGPSASGEVVLATPDSLYEVPLNGSDPISHKAGATGTPAAPAQVGGCAYGVWNDSQKYVRACDGADPDIADVPEAKSDSDLSLRVNQDLVILNDTEWGTSWKIMESMQLIENWEHKQKLQTDKKKEKEKETFTTAIENVDADRDQENRKPTATNDTFGVRAGQNIVLPVLRNDNDPDGDLLTAAVEGEQPSIGTVSRIQGGTQLQIEVADDATGSATFQYKVSDGRGGEALGTVELDVKPKEENTGPAPSDQSIPKIQVRSGASVSVNVLPYFQDPEGDAFYLADATVQPEDSVTFSADGLLTYNDVGLTTGEKEIAVTFRDEHGESGESTVVVEVVTEADLEPITFSDHVSLVEGRDTTVQPLENDLNPNGGDLELLDVTEADGLEVDFNSQAGTVAITGDTPDTYYLTYTVSAGAATSTGLIRVDVVEPDPEALKPVAVDDMSLVTVGTTDLIDPLENDVDPSGGVLVLNDIDVPEDSGIKASILNHSLLQVSATPDAGYGGTPVDLTYTVANGTGDTTGTIRVMVVKTDTQFAEPEAVPDDGVVRAGDVLSVDVLSNDHSPTASKLSLGELGNTEEADAKGTLETVNDTVRFTADLEATGEVTFSYTVIDETGRDASTNVTLTIVPKDAKNAPPSPENIEARTVSGEPVRIPIATSGVDPNGDSVLLQGVSSPQPTLGSAKIVDGRWIEYTSNQGERGTDKFSYQVMDRQGAIGNGEVLVGIAAPSEQNLPPNAVDDVIEVKPDREVQIRALQNDTDPEGAELSIKSGSVEVITEGIELQPVGEGEEANPITVLTPEQAGTYTLTYEASDGSLETPASVTVKVDPNAPERAPITMDDFVDATVILEADGEPVSINALENDYDPDGSMKTATFAFDKDYPGASYDEEGNVTVTPQEELQRIRYVVTDIDGQESAGYIWVPGTAKQKPLWVGDPIQVTPGETATIDLTDPDLVRVRPGADPVQITETKAVTAQHHDGSQLVVSESSLEYRAAEDYNGSDVISVPVTDGAPGDETAAQTELAIPVEVTGTTNEPPTIQGAILEVEQGEGAAELDLSSSASDPDPKDTLVFTADSSGLPAGMEASVDGDGLLTATAESSVPKATTADVPVTVTDSNSEPVSATVTLQVTGSRRPLVAAGLDEAEIDAGKTEGIDVLGNDSNPFPDGELTVSQAAMREPGFEVSIDGGSVEVTPPADFHGVATGTYTVLDDTQDPERAVTGEIRVNVIGVPERPSAPRIIEEGDQFVQLDFTSNGDNGAPIENYTVTSATGPAVEQVCDSTSCRIEGLTNDQEYTFQVTATNRVGESEPSNPSAAARPDVRPEKPAAPTVERGDGKLTVSWEPPVNRGSAIQSYTLQIIGGATGSQTIEAPATEYTWEGLKNGVEYSFRVSAKNAADEPSEWSSNSASEHPAGPPKRPSGKMTAERASGPLGGEVELTWPALSAAEANGEPVTGYILRNSEGGTKTIQGGDQRSSTWAGLDPDKAYTFSYIGVNSVSKGTEYSAGSNKLTPFSKPAAPTGVKATMDEKAPNGPNGTVTVTWNAADGRGTSISGYKVTWDGGSRQVDSGTSVTIDGLKNGTAYRFTVAAQNRFQDKGGISDLSEASGSVTPYTKPAKPSVGSSAANCGGAKDCDVSFTAKSGSGGGVGVKETQYRLNGGEWKTYNGKVTKTANSGESVKFEARVTNVKGKVSAVASTTQKAKTYTPPKPSFGGMKNYGPGTSDPVCTSSYCRKINVSVSNLEPGKTYELRMYTNRGADSGYWVLDGTTRLKITADGQGNWNFYDTHGRYLYYGWPDSNVDVFVDGKKVGNFPYPG